jgi:hypothetical protein
MPFNEDGQFFSFNEEGVRITYEGAPPEGAIPDRQYEVWESSDPRQRTLGQRPDGSLYVIRDLAGWAAAYPRTFNYQVVALGEELNPAIAAVAQRVEGELLAPMSIYYQLFPQHDSFFEKLAVNMPIIMAVIFGGAAASGVLAAEGAAVAGEGVVVGGSVEVGAESLVVESGVTVSVAEAAPVAAPFAESIPLAAPAAAPVAAETVAPSMLELFSGAPPMFSAEAATTEAFAVVDVPATAQLAAYTSAPSMFSAQAGLADAFGGAYLTSPGAIVAPGEGAGLGLGEIFKGAQGVKAAVSPALALGRAVRSMLGGGDALGAAAPGSVTLAGSRVITPAGARSFASDLAWTLGTLAAAAFLVFRLARA